MVKGSKSAHRSHAGMSVVAQEEAQSRSSFLCRNYNMTAQTRELTPHSREKGRGFMALCCRCSHAPETPCSAVCSTGSGAAFPGAPVFFLEVSHLHTDQTWCCLCSVIRSAHISRTGRKDIKTYHPTPSRMTCQEAVYLCPRHSIYCVDMCK